MVVAHCKRTMPDASNEENPSDELFDRDYLRFYAAELNDDTNDDEAATIAALLQLREGLRVLDLPCGHGRIARRLAAMGADVTGIDRSKLFLAQAHAEAKQHGVSVHYQLGDMRTLTFDDEFDVVLNWFTSFGYEDDDTLRLMLTRMHRAIKSGGRLLLETLNMQQCDLRPGETSDTKKLVDAAGTHFLIDRSHYDPIASRL